MYFVGHNVNILRSVQYTLYLFIYFYQKCCNHFKRFNFKTYNVAVF